MTTQDNLDHHHHLGSQTPHDPNSANSTPTNVSSKSAFIELQQHGYGFKGGYQHPHHFGSPGGQQNPHEASGFPSPRSLGYPFPPMHQNTYGYHLGSYAPQCSSPPKDGKLINILIIKFLIQKLARNFASKIYINIISISGRKTSTAAHKSPPSFANQTDLDLHLSRSLDLNQIIALTCWKPTTLSLPVLERHSRTFWSHRPSALRAISPAYWQLRNLRKKENMRRSEYLNNTFEFRNN